MKNDKVTTDFTARTIHCIPFIIYDASITILARNTQYNPRINMLCICMPNVDVDTHNTSYF